MGNGNEKWEVHLEGQCKEKGAYMQGIYYCNVQHTPRYMWLGLVSHGQSPTAEIHNSAACFDNYHPVVCGGRLTYTNGDRVLN